MAVINSLVLYLSLLSVITYGSYKMNYSKYETKTANEQHTGLEKIPKSLRGMTCRSLLGFYDKERVNSIKFPEFFIDNREGMAEFLKTTTDDNDISVYDAASNINKGSTEKQRLCGAAISGSPITSSSPHPFRNKCIPRMYKERLVLPLRVSRYSTDGRISWLFKKKWVSPTSMDGWVSRSSTDGRVSPTFSKKQDSPSSNDDTPTTPLNRKREYTTLRKNIWTIGMMLSKHTTKNYLLVFDKNGIIQSNVTIHRSF